MKDKTLNKQYLSLGLLDFINPVLCILTFITLLKNLRGAMDKTLYGFLLVGAIISILSRFIISIYKALIGLGKKEYPLPTILLLLTNTGLVISGVGIFSHVVFENPALGIVLFIVLLDVLVMFLYKKQNYSKMTLVIGAVGYGLIYIGFILMAMNKGLLLNAVLYLLAIILYAFSTYIGLKDNSTSIKSHWLIESSDILRHLIVYISTILLFA